MFDISEHLDDVCDRSVIRSKRPLTALTIDGHMHRCYLLSASLINGPNTTSEFIEEQKLEKL